MGGSMKGVATFARGTILLPFLLALIIVLGAWGLSAAAPDPPAAPADDDNYCDLPGESPDLIVGGVGYEDVDQLARRFGPIGGVMAYAFAGTACNIGTCWADWNGNDGTHPVIAQNLFKLKDGRFMQIGQAWVKHVSLSEDGTYCGTCRPADPSHLGVNCSDTYGDSATGGNARQNRMGDKAAVNAYTGSYGWPQADLGQTGDAIYKRLQVHLFDLDPALNVGATYFAEMQYVQPQDGASLHGENNASYRRAIVLDSDSTLDVELTGPTTVGQPAIVAWKAIDPSVILTSAHLPDDGRLYLGTKISYRGAGIWRYEYAIQNLNADRAPLAVSIPIPAGATVSGSSYHDVDYHSGAMQENTAWARTTTATAVQWKANTLVFSGMIPNALRWGTLYNFRVEVNAAPGAHAILLGYNAPPAPTYGKSLSIPTLTPSFCDDDGICDPGETCASCAADCAAQGGGSGCCGNGTCEPGENESRCFADCGQPLAAETLCGDGIDGDRDGSIDCFDSVDCCADAACDGMDGWDPDGDGFAAACDCTEADGAAWKPPGELHGLLVDQVGPGAGVMTTLTWEPAGDPGGTVYAYDLLRSAYANDFTAPTCLALTPGNTTTATDPGPPPAPGESYYYLVRVRNGCPNGLGLGPLGSTSEGTPRTAPACP